MKGWRAYYADGRRIDSSESSWAKLPPEGVVGVVEFQDPPYRKLHDGGDWIWMEEGEILVSGTVWNGWVDPPNVRCQSCIKRGAAIEDEEFEAIQAEMMADKRWPTA